LEEPKKKSEGITDEECRLLYIEMKELGESVEKIINKTTARYLKKNADISKALEKRRVTMQPSPTGAENTQNDEEAAPVAAQPATQARPMTRLGLSRHPSIYNRWETIGNAEMTERPQISVSSPTQVPSISIPVSSIQQQVRSDNHQTTFTKPLLPQISEFSPAAPNNATSDQASNNSAEDDDHQGSAGGGRASSGHSHTQQHTAQKSSILKGAIRYSSNLPLMLFNQMKNSKVIKGKRVQMDDSYAESPRK